MELKISTQLHQNCRKAGWTISFTDGGGAHLNKTHQTHIPPRYNVEFNKIPAFKLKQEDKTINIIHNGTFAIAMSLLLKVQQDWRNIVVK